MIDSDEDKLQAMEAGARAFFRGSRSRERHVRLAEAASNRADYRRVETFRRVPVRLPSSALQACSAGCLRLFYVSRVLVRLAEARHAAGRGRAYGECVFATRKAASAARRPRRGEAWQ